MKAFSMASSCSSYSPRSCWYCWRIFAMSLAGLLLHTKLLIQLLRNLEVKKVRPLHLHRRVLTAARDRLDLQGFIPVQARSLLNDAALILRIVKAHSDLSQPIPRLRFHLLHTGNTLGYLRPPAADIGRLRFLCTR